MKNQNCISDFSKQTGISDEHLKILKREAISYLSRPLRIDDLPVDSERIVIQLKKTGASIVRNRVDIYHSIWSYNLDLHCTHVASIEK